MGRGIERGKQQERAKGCLTCGAIVLGLAVIATVYSALTGSSGSSSSASARPGSPEVYARIAATTNCAELQETFNRSDENAKRNRANGNAFLAEVSLSYLKMSGERMREVGCAAGKK